MLDAAVLLLMNMPASCCDLCSDAQPGCCHLQLLKHCVAAALRANACTAADHQRFLQVPAALMLASPVEQALIPALQAGQVCVLVQRAILAAYVQDGPLQLHLLREDCRRQQPT